MQKLDQLTFTRFLAALAVVFFHSGPVFPVNAFPFNPLFTSGQTAVSYFFVLSGFVLAYVYASPGQAFDGWAYLRARVARIYPVYVVSFLFTCVYYIEIMPSVKTEKVLANLFLLQAWNPVYALSFNIAAWSLSVEVFFYVLFPLVALWAVRRRPRTLILVSIGFWCVSQLAHAVLYHVYYPEHHNLLLYFPVVHLNSFVLGMAGGIWFNRVPEGRDSDPRRHYGLLALGLGLVGLLLLGKALIPTVAQSFTLDAGLLAPFFLVIVLALARDSSSPLSRWLSSPRLVLLGDASFALFILHVPLRWLGERWAAAAGIPYAWFIYFYWVVMVGLSIVVFTWIERPARDWLRRNFSVLLLVAADAAVILISVYLGFALQLGTGKELRAYAEALRFMARAALPVYVLALIATGLYREPAGRASWSALVLRALVAGGLGATGITALMVLAAEQGWIEGYSRVAILISAAMIAGGVLLCRWALWFWKRLSSTRLPA